MKPRSNSNLPAVLVLLASLSLSGCSTILSSTDAIIGKFKKPSSLERIDKAEGSNSPSKRRPPPLLLSVPAAVQVPPAPAAPQAPALTQIDPQESKSTATPAKPAETQLPEQMMPFWGSTPPSGYFIPNEVLGIPARVTAKSRANTGADGTGKPNSATNSLTKKTGPAIDVSPAPKVVAGIYISPTTRAYFAAAGMDYVQTIVQPWEAFLQKSDIDVTRIVTSDSLLSTQFDVLILPSAVALNASEKSNLARLREQGSSVMATWLAGVRNEFGQWVGFDFMRQVLDTSVTGTTAADEEDTFIFPAADTPVSHQLPAGLRIWVERVPDWYPLRLHGKNTALHLMDWSRTYRPGKSSSTMVYDEREGGRPSRVVVLGLPERLWQSVAINDFNKILTDSLLWLSRRSDAHVATWPKAMGSGVMLAMDLPNLLNEEDLSFFSVAESFNGKANFFILSEHLEVAPEKVIERLKETPHEIAWLGDRFEEFKDLPQNKQSRRITTMLKEIARAGFTVNEGAGFHAPMESYDEKTNLILAEKKFTYQITDSGVSENLLPIVAAGTDDLLLYPRSLVAINNLLNNGLTPEVAASQFAEALRTHFDLGGLTVVPFEQGSTITSAQWKHILQRGFSGNRQPWVAAGKEIADWWKEYQRVSATVDHTVSPAQLTVTIEGEGALQQAVSILVNLPSKAGSFRLVQDEADEKPFSPALNSHDQWRQRISLQGGTPGTYRWYLLPEAQPKAAIPLPR